MFKKNSFGGDTRVIRIVAPTHTLVNFLAMLHLKLLQPQLDHLVRTMDDLMCWESTNRRISRKEDIYLILLPITNV